MNKLYKIHLDSKDDFYDQLSNKIHTGLKKEQLLILGDLNIRVGTDHT